MCLHLLDFAARVSKGGYSAGLFLRIYTVLDQFQFQLSPKYDLEGMLSHVSRSWAWFWEKDRKEHILLFHLLKEKKGGIVGFAICFFVRVGKIESVGGGGGREKKGGGRIVYVLTLLLAPDPVRKEERVRHLYLAARTGRRKTGERSVRRL